MPPQPLSNVKRNARVFSEPVALRRNPELATLIGDVISLWSHIEANLSVVLVRMLEGGVRSGAAMYRAVQSFRAQMAILEAVARITIEPEHVAAFEAVLALVRSVAKKRDKLVHWIWAYSPDVEDALLLINPNYALDYHTSLSEHLAKHLKHGESIEATQSEVPPIDPRAVFVYREKDLQEIIYELNTVWNVTETLIGCVTRTHHLWPSQWSVLTASPQILGELERRKSLRSITPSDTD
jgi:hypothetical protein